MSRRRLLQQAFGLTLIVLFLTGCGGAPAELTDTHTPVPPTVTLTPVTPTATPTNKPTPTATQTQVAQATATDTSTPAPTNTPDLVIGLNWTRPEDDMLMVYVPEGEFSMGNNTSPGYSDEQPVHTVYLDAYWIDQTEVTNIMYAKCVQDGSCQPPSDFSSLTRSSYYSNPDYADFPVIYVNWSDATAYCTWSGARLPSEAEWEKAARGTDGQLYPWGNETPGVNLLNYNENVGDTTEVGKYPQGVSPYGALDMAGNVWEWINDWYDSSYYENTPSRNPVGPSSGPVASRVLRGGSYYWNEFVGIRSASRADFKPGNSSNEIGFRCSRSLP